MNAGELLLHFDRIADAPDALSRLRQLVLDLAVRGRLLPQQPDDRPQTDALAHARKELSERAKATGRLRFTESAPIGAEEIGDQLPKGWLAARINDTGLYINGLAFKPSDWRASGLPIIRIQNLSDESREFNYAQGEFPDEVLVRTGDILVSWSATLDAYLWKRETGVLNQHIFRVIRATELTDSSYLLLLLKRAIRDLSESVHAHGLVMTHINRGPFLNHVVWLPPLAEQHRIVAKVDELMALCDRLEAARAKREAARDRLTAASLARLNTPDPETFREDARFVLSAIRELSCRPVQIDQLRRTILNLAVRGKLVSQDPSDSPPPIIGFDRSHDSASRLDMELPANWRWVRVADVAVARLGKMLDKAKNTGRPHPYLRNTNVHWFDVRIDDIKTISLEERELAEYRLVDGDVLICEGGHGIGRTAVWRGSVPNMVFQKALHRVRTGDSLDPDFFSQCCFVYFDAGVMQSYFTGVGIPHFTGKALAQLVFPLPPLAEQRRIVARVGELMMLCNQLEQSLVLGSAHRRQLLESLLNEVLEPAATEEDAA